MKERLNMKKHTIIKILSALVLISPLSSYAILSGVEVTANEYNTSPVVGIYRQVSEGSTIKICTGTLLNPTTILTAAHCFEEIDSRVIKVVRSLNLYSPNRVEIKISSNQVTIHPKYDSEYDLYDFAVIKLNQPIRLTENVAYPILANSADFENFTFYGYGRDLNQKSGLLKKVSKTKSKILSPKYGWENFLEFDQSDLVGPSKGDSGGPVFAFAGSTRYLVSVISSVIGMSEGIVGTESSLSTKVSSVLDWIKSYM